MSKLYRVHEFAEVAGVTVRTLHHYDRLGLLEPRRTAAGYRVYTLPDLERLEQIVALKFVGLPLKQIKTLLDRKDALQLPEALHMQRTVLEERRRLLERAIGAIESVEKVLQSGKPADAALLKKIIEVIEMQTNRDSMKKYFSDEAWAKWNQLQERSTLKARKRMSQAWLGLLREIETALNRKEDPAGRKAQILATRWMHLSDRISGGDLGIKTGRRKAWADRQHWPVSERKRIARHNMEKITEFIGQALRNSMKKYYSDKAWANKAQLQKQSPSVWPAWIELFRDVQASLAEDPAGKKAQALAKRWNELSHRSSGGDRDIQAGMRKAWKDRQHWPARLQDDLAPFPINKISRFIKKANAHRSALTQR
ncbi:MAG TPA: MerR family transcriptional regulator [Terriglobales bacterium]|jgi:DNA-binding transcriptional MerR regulator|nr:MerR family transcriptional regulator [Terriglobales bacterium]